MSENLNMTKNDPRAEALAWAMDIAMAYAGSGNADPERIPTLISSAFGAILGLSSSPIAIGITTTPMQAPPAVPVKKSITPDFIICLEDGKKFKSMKRHIKTAYGLTPEQYREKWHLQADYPMVAPNYAEARSKLAKSMGLGQARKKAVVKKAA